METDAKLLDDYIKDYPVGEFVYLPIHLFVMYLDEMEKMGLSTDRLNGSMKLYVWKNSYVDLHPDPNYV
jgi:hypothetical protein